MKKCKRWLTFLASSQYSLDGGKRNQNWEKCQLEIFKERPKEDCKTVQSKLIEINDSIKLLIKDFSDG